MPRSAALGGIVGQTDLSVIEEARERGPVLEHVIHPLADIVVARELGTFFPHPGLELGDERCDAFTACYETSSIE
jgi:hypothetical protein